MRKIDARDFYRSQAGCRSAIIQVFGAQIIPVAYEATTNEWEILAHRRPNKQLGAIGGASDIYIDKDMNVLGFESEQDTIRREFQEEVGQELVETEWHYICNVISINKYNEYPDVHGVGNYFYTLSTPECLKEYASGNSREGKPVIITLKMLKQELKSDNVFSNARPAFEKLIQLLEKSTPSGNF